MSTVAPQYVSTPFTAPEPEFIQDYSIRTNDLNLWYGDFQAFMDLSVNIKKGSSAGLIVPSGCG